MYLWNRPCTWQDDENTRKVQQRKATSPENVPCHVCVYTPLRAKLFDSLTHMGDRVNTWEMSSQNRAIIYAKFSW
jgi:hypothetical protein